MIRLSIPALLAPFSHLPHIGFVAPRDLILAPLFFASRISWRSASFKWLPSFPLLPAGCKFCIISSAPARLCCLLEGFDDREEPAWAIHIWEVSSASVTLAKANVVKPSLFFSVKLSDNLSILLARSSSFFLFGLGIHANPKGSIQIWILETKTDKDYLHPATQSDPDSQTVPNAAHNIWRSCNAALYHCQHTGFAGGRIGTPLLLRWFHASVYPNRNNPRIKPDYLHHRSSLFGYRFGRSGSSGFVGGFLRLRLFSRGLALRGRSCVGIGVDIGISAVPKSQTNPLSSSRSSERQKLHRNVLHSPRQNLKFYICYALLALVTQTTLADYIYNKSIMSKAKISPNKISFDKFSGSIKVLIF